MFSETAAPTETDSFTPFTFVHFGDPQIGMGEGCVRADSQRFALAIERANALNPDFVLVAGDLVNGRTQEEYAAFDSTLCRLNAPAKLIPGNHDILNEDDWDGLAEYRRRFGDDFYVFTHRNCRFICLNAMILNEAAATTPSSRKEVRDQWAWLESILQDARIQHLTHTFLYTHVPPFLQAEEEPQEYFNVPPDVRLRLLRLLRENGIRHIFTGHTHRTKVIESENFTIYTVGGTALVFDDEGFGYRIFRVYEDRIEQEYVRMSIPE